MSPLPYSQLPPPPNFIDEKTFTEQEFGQTLLQDTFINMPYPTKLTITEANNSLCAQGRIAVSLNGNLLPIMTALFGNAIFPFTARIIITSKHPLSTVRFSEDETSYVIMTPAGFSIKRGFASLSISMKEIQKTLEQGRIPDLPKLHVMQNLWFRDLRHDFFDGFAGVNTMGQSKKINKAINAQMPPSHCFRLKYADGETSISPKMSGNSPNGIMISSERLMSIRIVPTEQL